MPDARYAQMLARSRPESASGQLIAAWVGALSAHEEKLTAIESRVGEATARLENMTRPVVNRSHLRAAMTRETVKLLVTGGITAVVLGMACGFGGGWALRDSQLHKRCMIAYPQRADVCVEIWR